MVKIKGTLLVVAMVVLIEAVRFENRKGNAIGTFEVTLVGGEKRSFVFGTEAEAKKAHGDLVAAVDAYHSPRPIMEVFAGGGNTKPDPDPHNGEKLPVGKTDKPGPDKPK